MTEYQKHTTHTDALDTLGSIIDPTQKRDAIHLAVFPIEAAQTLYPGMDVKFSADGRAHRAYGANDDGAVGIVDPFLSTNVGIGDWFWLVVYPRQISSLRHVWEHDSFPVSGETDQVVAEADPHQIPVGVSKKLGQEVAAAEAWLRDWYSRNDTPGSFEDFIEVATEDRNKGWIVFSDDAYGSFPDEIWDHLTVYTGLDFDPDQNPDHFSCAC